MKKAAISNLFEIQSSQLALQKSQNEQVKKFAQMMVDDHTKAGEQLKSTLSTAKIDPGTFPTTLDAKHQKIEDKLNSASPAKFDKDYIKAQFEAHIETIALFKSYAESGQPEAVRFRIAAVESWRSRQSHHRLGCRAWRIDFGSAR